MIELIHLEKKYENSTPLADVNAVINDGDVIAIIGPSGTGKSTLIRCIDLLERPTGGKILLDGVDITAPRYDPTLARRKMGMVFQSFNLFGHLTVIENVMKPQIDILKRSRQEAYDTGVRLLRIGSDSDFEKDMAEIDRYCLKNDIPPRTKYRIRLAYEELVLQQLKPVITGREVQFTAVYSEKIGDTELTVSYTGSRFDPEESDDALSYEMLKNVVHDMTYRYEPEADLPNIVEITIK